MPPFVRRLALTLHVTFSVGWLGAVAAFLALAVAGVAGRDVQTVRAAYLAMELTGWAAVVPLSIASLLSGVAQSLGSPWGLLRHYWVVVKLLLNVLAVVVLLLHMQPTRRLAGLASQTLLSSTDLSALRLQLVADAGAALLVLCTAVALSVYKPRGLTRYGARRRRQSLLSRR